MISESVRRLNPVLFGTAADSRKKPQIAAKSQIEQTFAPKQNKSEAEWGRMIASLPVARSGLIIPQPTRFFRLEGGGSYTPDFIMITGEGVDIWEVKGGYRGPGAEQGEERYKRAAAQFDRPFCRFHLARKTKNGWQVTDWAMREM